MRLRFLVKAATSFFISPLKRVLQNSMRGIVEGRRRACGLQTMNFCSPCLTKPTPWRAWILGSMVWPTLALRMRGQPETMVQMSVSVKPWCLRKCRTDSGVEGEPGEVRSVIYLDAVAPKLDLGGGF